MRWIALAVVFYLATAGISLADRYVAPGAAGGGGSWADPADLQSAITASAAGEAVYLRYGTYTNTSQVVVSNKAGIVISGGWAGSGGSPGDTTNLPSVLTRNPANNIRILYAYRATGTVQNVTISGGNVTIPSNWANQYGGGGWFDSSDITLNNCVVQNNRIAKDQDGGYCYGGGLYVNAGALRVLGGTFSANRSERTGGNHCFSYGGAIYAASATVVASNVTFAGNYVYPDGDGENSFGYGGVADLSGGSAEFTGCAFSNNYAFGYGNGTALGGAIYAGAVGSLTLVSNSFFGNYAYGKSTGNGTPPVRGSILYVTGAGTRSQISDCRMERSSAPGAGVIQAEAVYLLSGTATVANCSIQRSGGAGITVAGGVLALTNGLMALNGSDGITVAGGAVSLVNATLADNLGWGLKRAGGTAALTNGIAWGNVLGGISNATSVSYTDSQESQGGTANLNTNPLFVYGYYLSVNGLQGQTADNVLTNAGSDMSANLGLNGRTTRTDGAGDSSVVDLGYHYAVGLSSPTMSNLALYVDAASGSNANDGLTPGTALRTITAALGKAIDGSTINVSTGRYTTGETFPLVVPVANLTLKGTNTGATVVYGDGANRLLTALAAGHLQVQGMTFQNGYQSTAGASAYGGGLLVQHCDLFLSNAILQANAIAKPGDTGYGYGGGLYAFGGRLLLDGVVVASNRVYYTGGNHSYMYGGGVYADTVAVICRNGTTFKANYINADGDGEHGFGQGGALFMSGGSAQLSGCLFTNNYAYCKYSSDAVGCAQGGAIYATGLSTFAISASTCTLNYAYADAGGSFAHTSKGGAIFLDGAATRSQILGCLIFTNSAAQTYACGDVWLNVGTLAMTNNLLAKNAAGAIRCAAGTATVVNCTLADNGGYGLTNTAAAVTVKNCIAWGNVAGGVRNATTVNYTDSQDGVLTGTGNISNDPLFVAPASWDYHEQSQSGSYHGGAWGNDGATSFCIDTGDPADPVAAEPSPNGGRINMGAYGGTAQASKTPSFPVIANASYGATNVLSTSAWLNAMLVGTGGAPTDVWAFWDTSDRTNSKTWAANFHWTGLPTTNLSYQAVGLTSNTWYWYTYYASNTYGEGWAAPSKSFKTFGIPAVNNSTGASAVAYFSATLSGNLTNGAGAYVWIYYWLDGATSSNAVSFGFRTEGVFSTNVTGLVPGSAYHYQCLASNDYGVVWSGAVVDFSTLLAGSYFVTPTGAGAKTGVSWSDAFDSIQSALNVSISVGDKIYLRYGAYTNTVSLNITNLPGVRIIGGWAGSGGLPGDTTNLPTVLTRNPANNIRIVYGNTATATLERVTIAGGYLNNVTDAGAGLYLQRGDFTLTNCVVINNQHEKTVDSLTCRGGGIWADSAVLRLVNSVFTNNALAASGNGNHTFAYGGCLYAINTTLMASNSTFFGNWVYGYSVSGENGRSWGGVAYLTGGGSATFASCTFSNNYNLGRCESYGGTVYATGLSALTLDSCLFTRNYAFGGDSGSAPRARVGGLMYLDGAGMRTRLSNCRMIDNVAEDGFYVWVNNGGGFSPVFGDSWISAGTAVVVNCEWRENASNAMTFAGARLSMTNCMLGVSGADGLLLLSGTANLMNVTLADNFGWGLRQTGGNATVLNSIAWGNRLGGLNLTSGAVSYTDSQEAQPGTGNLSVDPRYAYGYYLSVNGLQGQTANSPCIDAGNDLAANLGLDTRTTRTDGTGDAGGSVVDLGYHYGAGLDAATMSNQTLYVSRGSGSDANDGWTAGSPLKTLGAALGRTIQGTTVNLATGRYDTASGETFPLNVVGAHVTLRGTDRANTVIYGDGANKVMTCLTGGRFGLQGLTVENGYRPKLNFGAGLTLEDTDATLTNCTVRNCRIAKTSDYVGFGFGAGIYVRHGRVTLVSSSVSSNAVTSTTGNHGVFYGGGLYGLSALMTLSNVLFQSNGCDTSIESDEDSLAYGGALCLIGGGATVSGCTFDGNYVNGRTFAFGGGVYANGSTPVAIDSCTMTRNFVQNNTSLQSNPPSAARPAYRRSGGALQLEGSGSAATVTGCSVVSNGTSVTQVGGIGVGAGATVNLTNNLVARNWGWVEFVGTNNAGGGLVCLGGSTVTVTSCTLADNVGWGITPFTNGTPTRLTVKNGIVWTNTAGGINTNFGLAMALTYTDVQDSSLTNMGAGNISADPLFVNAAGGDYHEKGTGGAWSNGTWIRYGVDSPCIDKGDPSSDWSLEPRPNGRRINMGAYGNTAQASKIYAPQGGLFIIY